VGCLSDHGFTKRAQMRKTKRNASAKRINRLSLHENPTRLKERYGFIWSVGGRSNLKADF